MNLPKHFHELSDEQWAFLAVLEAFGHPVGIDLAGQLAPLLPGPLFDLLEKTQSLGWVKKCENNRFSIEKDLPPEVLTRLQAINTPKQLGNLARKITYENGIEKSDLQDKLTLLDKAGWAKEAGECEIELARQALKENLREKGHIYIEQAVKRLIVVSNKKGVGELFLSAALEFSNLIFSLGSGFTKLEEVLLNALAVADRLGDQRAHALINQHLGRLYYFSDRRDDALVALSVGFEEIEALGDEDIREQSAEFLGIFFFIKGLLREALEQFDKAEKVMQSGRGDSLINPLILVFLGYCATFSGQFHRAIGSLDFNWRLARERSDPALASSIQAVLGTVLVLLKKDREGMVHLQQAQKEAIKIHNALGFYLAGGGLAQQYFMEGRMEKAYELLKKTFQEGISAGLIRQFAAPWILEMLYEFHRLGFEPIPELEFSLLIERLSSGINIHLQGVALRLRAKESLVRGGDLLAAEGDLTESEKCLRRAGDPVQLSKTFLEKARLELGRGNRKLARQLIQNAKGLLGGYGDEFFPDEFRHLLEKLESPLETKGRNEEFLERYLEMIESLYPSENQSEILAKMLTSTSRIFGAERSGLFWFPSGNFTSLPELRAACNLTLREVRGESFKNSLGVIRNTLQTNQPQVGRTSADKTAETIQQVRSLLCIPIEIEGKTQGVLYYDNSYLDDAFDFSDPGILKQMARHTNLLIERRFNYLRIKEERNQLASEKFFLLEQEKEEIFHHSRIMTGLLEQADRIAGTESSVLILGETGTGKELLSKRIHAHSQLADGPFIVVDVTTIPENLLESELFGHERGAFTGADNRKIGRLELAHKGTLLLDEVGELPLTAQTKLLRVLQEKNFHRLGGTRTISSNFRLIAATNRRLEEEVAAGRFRQDLFYRLNVIPLHLPPLRERQEDITLLANYFIKQYGVKYKRSSVGLTDEQEKMLRSYRWPGNIRELKNVIERAVILSAENQLELNLPADIQSDQFDPFADLPSLEEVQRRYIKYIIQKSGGRISGPDGAAEILGMKRTSLYSRMRALGMRLDS
jgi:transcriptional regulator with GAF, ATPase, and Fis domain/tetratricopeptide (TPR) repeat protein